MPIADKTKWSINFTNFYYGIQEIKTTTKVIIVASPTSLMYFPSNVYDQIVTNIKKNKEWGFAYNTGLFACYCYSIDEFENIQFRAGGNTFSILKDKWINFVNGKRSYCEFNIASTYSSGSDIELGIPLLNSYYHYLDYETNNVMLYSYENNVEVNTSTDKSSAFIGGFQYIMRIVRDPTSAISSLLFLTLVYRKSLCQIPLFV